MPQLPRSVQALPSRLTLCRLSWGQQAGLRGPNHRFPGMVFLPLEDAGPVSKCAWHPHFPSLETEEEFINCCY